MATHCHLHESLEEEDILQELLIDQKEEVVIFGEGNFTFSIALAALRGSWDGITSTRYEPTELEPCFSTHFEPITHWKPKPCPSDVQALTIESCIRNGMKLGDNLATILQTIRKVLHMYPPPVNSWIYGIDAINSGLDVKGKIVWFQCPWISCSPPPHNKHPLLPALDDAQDNLRKAQQLLTSVQQRLPMDQHCLPMDHQHLVHQLKCLLDLISAQLSGVDLANVHLPSLISAQFRLIAQRLPASQHYSVPPQFCPLLALLYRFAAHEHLVAVQSHLSTGKFIPTTQQHLDAAQQHLDTAQRNFDTAQQHFDATKQHLDAAEHHLNTAQHPAQWHLRTAKQHIDAAKQHSGTAEHLTIQQDLCTALTHLFHAQQCVLQHIPRLPPTAQPSPFTPLPPLVQPPSSTGELIARFLAHMAEKQATDDYVLIGITEHSQYVQRYALEQFINGTAKYSFVGADRTLIRDILRHGYYHQGVKDIHDYIFEHHVTLVFQRNRL